MEEAHSHSCANRGAAKTGSYPELHHAPRACAILYFGLVPQIRNELGLLLSGAASVARDDGYVYVNKIIIGDGREREGKTERDKRSVDQVGYFLGKFFWIFWTQF